MTVSPENKCTFVAELLYCTVQDTLHTADDFSLDRSPCTTRDRQRTPLTLTGTDTDHVDGALPAHIHRVRIILTSIMVTGPCSRGLLDSRLLLHTGRCGTRCTRARVFLDRRLVTNFCFLLLGLGLFVCTIDTQILDRARPIANRVSARTSKVWQHPWDTHMNV